MPTYTWCVRARLVLVIVCPAPVAPFSSCCATVLTRLSSLCLIFLIESYSTHLRHFPSYVVSARLPIYYLFCFKRHPLLLFMFIPSSQRTHTIRQSIQKRVTQMGPKKGGHTNHTKMRASPTPFCFRPGGLFPFLFKKTKHNTHTRSPFVRFFTIHQPPRRHHHFTSRSAGLRGRWAGGRRGTGPPGP